MKQQYCQFNLLSQFSTSIIIMILLAFIGKCPGPAFPGINDQTDNCVMIVIIMHRYYQFITFIVFVH